MGDPHRLEAHSPHPAELFEDIARQIFRLIIDPKEVGAALREKVSVEGESLDHLLREWVVALVDMALTQHMLFNQFRITALKTPEHIPYSLQAEAVGELLDPHRHTFRHEPADLKIQQVHLYKDASGYHAEITF